MSAISFSRRISFGSIVSLSSLLLMTSLSAAQDMSRVATLPPSELVVDKNGDGKIDILAFGDSITRGVGDVPPTEEGVFTPFEPREEAGYPLRLETMLGINIQNLGVPGDRAGRAVPDRDRDHGRARSRAGRHPTQADRGENPGGPETRNVDDAGSC